MSYILKYRGSGGPLYYSGTKVTKNSVSIQTTKYLEHATRYIEFGHASSMTMKPEINLRFEVVPFDEEAVSVITELRKKILTL